MLTVQDVSYGDARGLHSKWQKHQAFMAELAPNQAWLEKIETVGAGTGAWKPRWAGGGHAGIEPCRGGHQSLGHCRQEGKELASRKPQYGDVVRRRLEELRGRWDGLRGAAEEKGRQLFEANRSALYARSCGELESLLGRAEEELRATEQAKDLRTTNLLLKRLTVGGSAARRAAGWAQGCGHLAFSFGWGSASSWRVRGAG